MKDLLAHARNLAAPLLLAWAWPAFGQSLGQASGEVWIGQPLDVTVRARFQSTDARDACVQSEVAYGDTRLAPSRVHATVLGEGEHRRVRITSDQPVDEPLVTVTLRVGCGSTLARSYTLLPDMPSEAVLARLVQPRPALARATPSAPTATLLAAGGDPPPRRLRLTPAVDRMPAAVAPRPRAARAYPLAAATAAVPRLRLEAIEADAVSLLRVSAHLSPPGDSALRAKAAMLWRAVSADPQDVMRGDAALQDLENELAQLRQAAGSTRAELATLRQHIDQARPWYRSARMAQALGLLVLATAGAMALVAWRRRRADAALPWYEPSAPGALEPQGADSAARAAGAPARQVGGGQGLVAAQASPALRPTPAVSMPAANMAGPASAGDLVATGDIQPRPRPRAAASGLLRVETLAAILDEAEFLASLGLHTEAIDVLKAYLADSGSPAPVAFLELMRVCSLAEDPQALEAVRRRYAKVHGVPPPTLEQVSAQGGLEEHRALAERVTRAWGSADVLPLIEEALFDLPAGDAVLGLQAARDLICLYDVALVLAAEAGAGPGPGRAQEQPLAPWADAEHLAEAQAFVEAAGEDFGGHRFGLDVDLSVVPHTLPDKPREPDAQELAALMLAGREAARQAAERAAREAEEAFNAAVASERAPISRL
jgi:hypothetical protein